jgi:tripartite-type tricarboxylate transporter receptor subunit TctC
MMAPRSPLRRRALAALVAMAGVLFVTAAPAQDWPTRPIRMIVPYPPAGGTDVVARIVNEQLAPALGATIVVDNKGGAAGNLGTELAAKSPPDGYTVLFTLSSHTINPRLYTKLPFDVEKDFVAVSLAAYIPQVLVAHPSVPASNVQELIALLKAQPGKFNYASVGIGSPGHVAGELFKLKTGTSMTHVPYKGGGPAVQDTIGGQVQLLFVSMPAAWQHVKAGKLKVLGVTSDKRSIAAPEVPTIAEQGLSDYVVNSWYGMLVPAKTPPAVVSRLNAAMTKVLKMPEVRDKLLAQGAEATSNSPAEFEALIREELKAWDYVIREAKISPEG